ncbi:autotransporter domain-containing protein [Simkania sp.]|uniref:autotransporter family protein n=1 Tax=Simkania sp. TaxID=34094 RepID=UPI003B52F6EF
MTAIRIGFFTCTFLLFGSLSAGQFILIGGDSGEPGYAAQVSPKGVAKSITGSALTGDGLIYSVALNNSGIGIIGGYTEANVPYVALVSPSGVASKISGADAPTGNGEILGVAINHSGVGIVGGSDSNGPYAALVSSSGVASKVSGADAPTGIGLIKSVSINDAGLGIIGGRENDNNTPYAALVSPSGIATKVSGADAPTGKGSILSVSINDAGLGIIGGNTETTAPYAALVSPSGIATKVSGADAPSGLGVIFGTDINDTGMGIIGGADFTNNSGYAALVSPSGVATKLSGEFSQPGGSGLIQTVAISDAGIGVIGGNDDNNRDYAALVSPTGVVTTITGIDAQGFINSVAIIDSATPKSWGPGNTYPNALFALSTQLVPSHSEMPRKRESGTPKSMAQEVGLLVDATDDIRGNFPCQDDTNYALWFAPFGAYAHNKKEQKFPSMTNWIGGGMLGFDYRGLQNTIIGVGAAYAFNRVNYSDSVGHARFHQEFLTLYGSWGQGNILIDAALWGGFYQMHNKRKTLNQIHSRAHVNGWLLSPHLGISTPFYAIRDWFVIAPFVMFDWASNWQGKVRETGASGLNLRIARDYTSMLRSEGGLRFYETLTYNWGNLTFEEKVSYVNKKPFNTGSESAYFAGSPSTFGVEVFPGKTQNLGVVRLSSQFMPCKSKYPFGSISYQGEFGSMFQSHVLIFEIGGRF